MGINVVRTILRIILENEDCRRSPILALGQCFDQTSDREIVVRDIRTGCIRAGPGSLCVVAPDTNDLELRKIAVLFVLAELFEPAIDAVVVANLKVPSREGHTEVPFQRALIRKVLTLWLVVSRALGVA